MDDVGQDHLLEAGSQPAQGDVMEHTCAKQQGFAPARRPFRSLQDGRLGAMEVGQPGGFTAFVTGADLNARSEESKGARRPRARGQAMFEQFEDHKKTEGAPGKRRERVDSLPVRS